MNLAIATALFIALLCVLDAVYLMFKNRWSPETERLKKQLRLMSEGMQEREVNIVRRRPLSTVPWLNSILSAVPLSFQLDRLLVQADSKYSLGAFLLFSLSVSMAAFCVTYMVTWSVLFGAVSFVAGGGVCLLALRVKKRRRMKRFEEQLPDALELVARSLKAGHALSGGLQMVAQEFSDPIGTEFQKTVTQIGFGVSVEQALRNMTDRIDSADLKFLTVAVIIQRETGGNLAEILDGIGKLIRGRFKLRAKVVALSAEGKFSALILTGIPFAIAAILFVINPKYINILVTDPLGKILILAALVMMGAGIGIMKKMIAIKI